MDVAAKLPTMENAALTMLHANAERLERSGTVAQQAAAARLIPLIAAELAARDALKLSQAQAKAGAPKRAKAPAKAKASATKPAKKAAASAASEPPTAITQGVEADVR